MKREPLVSVLMPVFNGELFLRKAIDSILGQTYQNFELLIADDGSTDETWKIIRSCQSNKVRAFRFRKNLGAFPRTNFLLKKAKGAFIALMDSDDISCPERLETQVSFLRKNKGVIVVGSQANLIDKDGKYLGKKVVPTKPEAIYRQFGFVHPMIHPSCVIHRKIIPVKDFAYFTRFGVNSDYHTFISLLRFGQFANLPQVMLDYRVHGTNSSLKNPRKCFLNSLRIRWLAVREYSYKMDLLSAILTLFSIPAILLAPAGAIDFTYQLLRWKREGVSNLPSYEAKKFSPAAGFVSS